MGHSGEIVSVPTTQGQMNIFPVLLLFSLVPL